MSAADQGAATAGAAKVHISLNVADLERSVTFYQALFGVGAHKRRPGYANFEVANPPLKLALEENAGRGNGLEVGTLPSLVKGPPTRTVGALNHLGMVVNSRAEVEQARERLIAAGLATFDERDTVCCFALQDKVWVHDPDGNGWEIYVLLDDLLDQVAAEGETQRPACCVP